jgi:hypothetical protein
VAIAHVQQHEGNDSGTTTLSITCSSTTAGNLITVQSENQATGAPAITGITDNAGNSYVRAPGYTVNDGFQILDMWYCKNCLSGATTITVTYAANSTAQAVMDEWSGASITAPFVSASHIAQTAVPVSPNATATQSGALLIATVIGPAGAGVNAPFVGLNPAFESAAACFAYDLNPPLSPTHAVWTPTTSTAYLSSIALFQVTSAVSPAQSSMLLVF